MRLQWRRQRGSLQDCDSSGAGCGEVGGDGEAYAGC